MHACAHRHTHMCTYTHFNFLNSFGLFSDVSMDQGIDVANTMRIIASLIALK